MKVLAIHSWARVFEPSLLKDSTGGVALPMKRGTGISKMAKIKGGAAAYGIFISLLPIALACVPRGTLIYTDKAGVHAHDAESLALVTGFPIDDVNAALGILIDIGWLEEVEFQEAPKPSSATQRLEDVLRDEGAKLTFRNESLIDEWYQAVKDLTPKQVKSIFKTASPGINFPRDFVKVRKEVGL